MNAQETLQAILDSDKNLEAVERDEFSSDDESLDLHGRRPGEYIYKVFLHLRQFFSVSIEATQTRYS